MTRAALVHPTGKRLVLCMKWGARYPADFANRLYSMVARNMGAEPFDFVCFTDEAGGLDAGIDARPLPPFPGVPPHLAVTPWRKLSLWQADLGEDLTGRDALVLDLDLVVTGSLQDFFAYRPGRYAVVENPTKVGRNIGNTSVFRFTVGSHPEIYDEFIADPDTLQRKRFRIEQEFISDVLHRQGEQVFWPRGWVVSFKENLLPPWPLRLFRPAELPADTKVVIFHGKPDPDEARDGRWPVARSQWMKKIYKNTRPVPWIADHWR